MIKLPENNELSRESAKDVLGEEFFRKFAGEKGCLRLDDSFNSFLDRCHLVKDLLETKGLFLRVYERRDKFRYVIKKE